MQRGEEFTTPLIKDPQGQPYVSERYNATAPSSPSSGPPSPQYPPPRQPSFRPYRGSPDLPIPKPYSAGPHRTTAFDMTSTRHRAPLASSIKKMSKGANLKVIGSYAFDWIILIATGVVGVILGNVSPNKRFFSLADPNISFPFTEREIIPSRLLLVLNAGVPIICIAIIALIFVPGSTVPPGTPKSLIWRRKLWELHTGWLGLALSLCSAWIITQGMKNLFGKPRPDLLARCKPDLDNFARYVVGGIANVVDGHGQLVSVAICTSTGAELDDGFRSYPSGHSSSAAAGLIYLTLFIASKFAITIPWLAPTVSGEGCHSEVSAFPSRLAPHRDADAGYELDDRLSNPQQAPHGEAPTTPGQHVRTVLAARRTAAAPPLYLLVISALPTFVSVFVAGSRWPDFRHHGFDILFGWLIGLGTAIFAFRFYHLPIGRGAGWAWGPRSSEKAFWGGVGSVSYATGRSGWREGDGVEKRRGEGVV